MVIWRRFDVLGCTLFLCTAGAAADSCWILVNNGIVNGLRCTTAQVHAVRQYLFFYIDVHCVLTFGIGRARTVSDASSCLTKGPMTVLPALRISYRFRRPHQLIYVV